MNIRQNIRHYIKLIVYSFAITLVIAGAEFMIRAPVLMVTDNSLNLLYGISRANIKQVVLSLKLFRRFVPVVISENAGPDIVIAAVRAAAKKPRAVLFPYYYAVAAQRFSDEEPDIPAIVLAGRQNSVSQQTQGPLYIGTDTAADFFKAGIIAAFLTGDNDGTILVSHDRNFGSGDREAFENGLLSQGVLKNIIYLQGTEYFSAWENVSCVVATGLMEQFFEENHNIPIILFSWIDPEMTPIDVKVIFSDSPWSQVYEALRVIKGGIDIIDERKALFSELIILGDRIQGKRALERELKKNREQ